MGKKNIVFNDYISHKERFADFYNGIVFHGQQVVRPEALTTLDSKLWRRKREQNSYREYIRDNVKLWNYEGQKLVLGLEPEASLHFALPVKYMNYESIQHDRDYQKQKARHRSRKDLGQAEYISGITASEQLMPVITIGIYLGQHEWTGTKSMNRLIGLDSLPFRIRDEIRPFCNDFHVNLLDIHKLETSDVFVTDLREVFGFLKRQNDWTELERYVMENETFRHLKEDAFDVIATYSDSRKLAVDKEKFNNEEGFDMCLALQQMEEQARGEGLIIGRDEGRIETLLFSIHSLMESIGMTSDEAMHVLKIPEEEQLIYRKKLIKGEDV